MAQCLICNENVEFTRLALATEVKCPRCTNYKITSTAFALLQGHEFSDRQIANISGWLRENSGYSIDSYNIEKLSEIRTPSFHEKADKLLLCLEKMSSYAGEALPLDNAWFSMAWAVNEKELLEITKYLGINDKLIYEHLESTLDSRYFKIGPEGWSYLDSIRSINAQSTQGFVAMWFSDEMQHIYYDVISEGIQNAGYKPHRVDQREHNDKIDDEIIAQIRSSRFVLADFTGQRGGVYYEAGFAKGLGVEVIWTCREDEVDQLHFDIRQYNCILWSLDKLDEFRDKIKYRIEAILGHG
jgi:hypothetical protein